MKHDGDEQDNKVTSDRDAQCHPNEDAMKEDTDLEQDALEPLLFQLKVFLGVQRRGASAHTALINFVSARVPGFHRTRANGHDGLAFNELQVSKTITHVARTAV